MSSYFEFGETTGMRGLANRLGLRYCETPADRSYKEDVGDLARVGPLVDGPEPVTDLMYGRYENVNLEVFKYLLSSYAGDPGHPARSCALLTFSADFPPLSIVPHSRMSRLRLRSNSDWLAFAGEDFRQRFSVTAADNDTARVFLDDRVLHWLMSGRDDIHIEFEGGALIGHMPLISDDEDPEWNTLIDYVVGFHHVLPEQAWVTYSVFGQL